MRSPSISIPRPAATVQRVSGTWSFNPAPQSTATGSFVMHATDDGGSQAVPVG